MTKKDFQTKFNNYLGENLFYIYETTQKLWKVNLNNITEIKYILFCEAPPFSEDGNIENYVYKLDGTTKGNLIKAPYKALCKPNNSKYPSKTDMINSLNKSGLIFIDLSPFAMQYSNKERNSLWYKKIILDSMHNTNNLLRNCNISTKLKIMFSQKSLTKTLNGETLKIRDLNFTISQNMDITNKANYPCYKRIINFKK